MFRGFRPLALNLIGHICFIRETRTRCLNFIFRIRLHKSLSNTDLVKTYDQIRMAADDIAKTAITAHFRTYEFLRMPFSLRCVAQTFQ